MSTQVSVRTAIPDIKVQHNQKSDTLPDCRSFQTLNAADGRHHSPVHRNDHHGGSAQYLKSEILLCQDLHDRNNSHQC